MTRVIVVCGVSGSGKSSVARALAARLALPFQEGDDLHPPPSIARMRSGIALDDDSRRDWLTAVGAWIDTHVGRGGVITCSALRRDYRRRLVRGRTGEVRLLYLHAAPQVLEQRLRDRQGHFMPASLLPSQLATLEPPGVDEGALVIEVGTLDVDTIVEKAVLLLGDACAPSKSATGGLRSR